MKKIAALSFLVFLCSCRFFDGQVPNEEELLQKRLKEINWKEVSSYPTIAECDAITDKEMRKDCFFAQMTLLIQKKLDIDTLALMYPEVDTIQVKVTVFSNATLRFEPQLPPNPNYNMAQIDSLIKKRLVNFPPVVPAQKEGVPVTTQFVLPVILSVQK